MLVLRIALVLFPLCLSAITSTAYGNTLNRPNVLFIIVDDLNDWIGPMKGNPHAITPNLDKLFSQSTRFDNAHCNAPVCSASRSSMLSGLRPSTTGWYSNQSSIKKTDEKALRGISPLPLHFRNNGYITLAGGKIYHRGVADFNRDLIWSEHKSKYHLPEEYRKRGHGYGGDFFYPFPRNGGQIYEHFDKRVRGQSLCWEALEDEDIPNGLMPDEELSAWAVKQLQQTYSQPFFLAVGFLRPHVPYTAPKKYFDLYKNLNIESAVAFDYEMSDIPTYGKAMAVGLLPGGDHKNVMAISEDYDRQLTLAYLACISFIDDQVGKVLDALNESDHKSNTIVVFCSDHGQNLGEKKNWRKQCLWEESTRVPLAFRIPKKLPQRCRRSVSLVDVYPTLVDLCNLPSAGAIDGVSLMPLISYPESNWDRPAITTWHYKNHSIRSQNWRYSLYRDDTEELYDHIHDPGEHCNLAHDPECQPVIDKLRKWIPKTNASPLGIDEKQLDPLDEIVEQWSKNNGPPAWLN